MRKATKDIPRFSNYSITVDGRVWSKPHKNTLGHNLKGKWLKLQNGSSGYKFIVLSVNSKKYTRLIHRLVLETYIGTCPMGMESRHLDGNKQNNRIKNLCWGTPQENELDKIRHGTKTRGEQCSWAKLTEQDVRMIIYMYRTGLFTQDEIAPQYGISRATVSDIIREKSWRHLWAS